MTPLDLVALFAVWLLERYEAWKRRTEIAACEAIDACWKFRQ